MANAQAFISSGGRAIWRFIIFRHNEHQIDLAKSTARQMGFDRFEPIKTGRFFDVDRQSFRESRTVKDVNGNVIDTIEIPRKKENTHAVRFDLTELNRQYGSIDNFYPQTTIRCKAIHDQSIYISTRGLVFPCCWIDGVIQQQNTDQINRYVAKALADFGGEQSISLHHHELAGIVQSRYFRHIKKSLTSNEISPAGRMQICARSCGKGFDMFQQQYKKGESLQTKEASQAAQ